MAEILSIGINSPRRIFGWEVFNSLLCPWVTSDDVALASGNSQFHLLIIIIQQLFFHLHSIPKSKPPLRKSEAVKNIFRYYVLYYAREF